MTTQELLASLQAGLEYAQECLAVHDRDRGRTTPRNKRHAEEMALDIAGLSGCINHIQRHFGSNVSLPQPKETKNLWDHRYAAEQLNAMSRQLMQSEGRVDELTQEIQSLTKNYDDLNATLNKTIGDLTIYKHQLTVARKDAEGWKDKYLTSEESLGQDITNISQQLDVATKERDDAQLAFVNTMRTLQVIVSRGFYQQPPWIDQVDQLTSSMIQTAKAWGMLA